jgi:hypothetical protein
LTGTLDCAGSGAARTTFHVEKTKQDTDRRE